MSAPGIARTPDYQPPPTPSALRSFLTRHWPLFVTFWLVFVVTGPVAMMLESPRTPQRMLIAVAWTVAFFAAYLWLMLYKPFRRAELTTRERWIQIALLLVLTGLVLYIDLASPPGWFWIFIFVLMPAGVVLPTAVAAGVTIAITLLACGVEVVRGTPDVIGSVPGIALWGLATITFRRLFDTVEELRMAREELARLAVAEERLRFARDLHDLLGHSLSLITLKSELAGRLIETDRARAASEVADIERVARQALREVREAVGGYRRPTLERELAGVRDLLAAAGITARITSAAGPLPPAINEALAWAVREGVTNVIRHSGARHCAITVTRAAGMVRAEVSDDGRGGPEDAMTAGAGSGLRGLAERIAALDGMMTAGAGPGGGFRLRIELPVTDSDERSSPTPPVE